jgi:hypothetical protein
MFDVLDWSRRLRGMQALAQLTTHIPNKGEQMIRFYAYYPNKSQELRKKAGTDDEIPALVPSAQEYIFDIDNNAGFR